MHAQRWPRINHSSAMEEHNVEDDREKPEPAPYADLPDVSDPVAKFAKKCSMPCAVVCLLAAVSLLAWVVAGGVGR